MITVAKAWIAKTQQRVADLNNEMTDLHIRHEEVTDTKEMGKKLLALIEHARKD
jgi:hypothetical protein